MSKLTTLSSNQKQFIKGGVIFLLIAIFLTSIVLCTYYLLFSTVTTEQLKYFEEVAKDVYSQKPSVLYEVPDDVNVSMDDFSITVSDSSFRVTGSVTASIKDGKLVFEYDDGNFDRILLSLLISLASVMTIYIGGSLIYSIFKAYFLDYIKHCCINWHNPFKKRKNKKNSTFPKHL